MRGIQLCSPRKMARNEGLPSSLYICWCPCWHWLCHSPWHLCKYRLFKKFQLFLIYFYQVLEGQKLTLPCIDNTYGLNTDWSKNSIEVTCQSDATFAVPSQWPQCAPRQSCGNPPTVPNGSGLKADNPSATPAVTQTATYR